MTRRKRPAADDGVPSGAPSFRALGLLILALGVALVVMAQPAEAAQGGTVDVTQNCDGWEARVELNHQVAPFRTVEVFSTIPGHPGIIDGHFDSTYGLIWMAGGSENNTTGTVTLRISAGSDPVFTATGELIPALGCEEPTTTSSSSTTTSTTAATTTTTLAVPQPPSQPKTIGQVTTMADTGPRETRAQVLFGLLLVFGGVAMVRLSTRAR